MKSVTVNVVHIGLQYPVTQHRDYKMSISVTIKHGQDPNRAIQKLKNKLIQEGLFVELKRRRYYAKPSLKKRLKREEAEKQRVKDYRKAVRNAQQQEDQW